MRTRRASRCLTWSASTTRIWIARPTDAFTIVLQEIVHAVSYSAARCRRDGEAPAAIADRTPRARACGCIGAGTGHALLATSDREQRHGRVRVWRRLVGGAARGRQCAPAHQHAVGGDRSGVLAGWIDAGVHGDGGGQR